MSRVTRTARTHQRKLIGIRDTLLQEVNNSWEVLNANRLSQSWYEHVGPNVVAATTMAQRAAASQATPYVQEIVDEGFPGPPEEPEGRVNPSAFAGTAADGRSLETLLYMPVIHTKQAIADGATVEQALQIGKNSIQVITSTEMMDAGRTADSVAITAQPKVQWYVRVLTPPSCPKCTILAGRYYRWSVAFERHPHCDCVHLPAAVDPQGELMNPWDESLTIPEEALAAGHVQGLSKADREAIELGADMNQVINAHRNMTTAAGGRKATLEGTTRKGFARLFMRQPGPRLRPEALLAEADSREEAIRLLKNYGYLVE